MMLSRYVPVQLPKNASSVVSSSIPAVTGSSSPDDEVGDYCDAEYFEPEPEKVQKGSTDEGKLMKVICLQQSNGSFNLDGAFGNLLDSSLENIFEGE